MPILIKSQENFSKRSGKSQEKFLNLTCGNPDYGLLLSSVLYYHKLTVIKFKKPQFQLELPQVTHPIERGRTTLKPRTGVR